MIEEKIFDDSKSSKNYIHLTYYNNGRIKNKSIVRNGFLNGRMESFTKEGLISKAQMFSNDTLHGSSIFYDTTKKSIVIFDTNNKDIFIEEFYWKGHLQFKYYYLHDGFLVYDVRPDTTMLVGRIIYLPNSKIDASKSYYYTISCPDTLIVNEDYKIEIIAYYGNRKKLFECKIHIPSSNFELYEDTQIIDKENKFSFYIKPNKIGYNTITGVISVLNSDTTLRQEFLVHEDFYVTSPN